ncbi:MAG: hypothetical protein ACOZBH_05235 [Patescibacteria group bacterium]
MRKLVLSLLIMMLFIMPAVQAQAKERPLVEDQLREIFDRYSHYLDLKYYDEFGSWLFKAPSYGYGDWIFANSPRLTMSFAAFYKYRAQNGDPESTAKIGQAIRQAIFQQRLKPSSMYSFDGAIANFLIVRMIEQVPEALSAKEIDQYRKFLNARLPEALRADDTENRAALAAVYWRYCADYLEKSGYIIPPDVYQTIDGKIDRSVSQSLSSDFLYRENNQTDFSLHYHVLESFLLTVYGDWTKQVKFVILGREMNKNTRLMSFGNGFLETALGLRPAGANSQTYLMAGLLSKRFKFADYNVFLDHLAGSNFFSDPANVNRLEWHNTLAKEERVYHDDYSFANIAELALVSGLLENQIQAIGLLELSNAKTKDSATFYINNMGNEIIFTDKILKKSIRLKLSTDEQSTEILSF